jgi:hypothetical protein
MEVPSRFADIDAKPGILVLGKALMARLDCRMKAFNSAAAKLSLSNVTMVANRLPKLGLVAVTYRNDNRSHFPPITAECSEPCRLHR